jgi:hypothetical protein
MWQVGATPTAGTTLDLRSTTSPAKIDTRGLGLLIVEHLRLTQAGASTDTNPFIQSTNTTVTVRDCAFYGYSTLTQSTCVQDAIVLGGTTTTTSGAATDPFQGYGSSVERCYFARIRRGVFARAWSNSVRVLNNTFSLTCGGGSSYAAIHFYGTDGFSWGSYIAGNLIEMGGYVYGIRFTDSARNVCVANAFWDDSGSLVACHYLEGAGTYENTLDGIYTGQAASKRILDSSGQFANGPGQTFKAIATAVLTSDGTVTFSSIPGTYKHLILEVSGRGNRAAVEDPVYVRFNGDGTNGNYDWQEVRSSATTVASSESIGTSIIQIGVVPSATASSGPNGAITAQIHNYAATTFQKSIIATSGHKVGTSSGNVTTRQNAGFWRSTAAITSVTVGCANASLLTGTIVSLYGVGT